MSTLRALAKEVGTSLQQRGLKLATAESCTGGGLAHAITSVPGSSQWFDRGFITYSNEAKRELLGVRALTLARHGAVSEQTAIEMAKGALRNSHAKIGIAITGIAGPSGDSDTNPIGTVWFAISIRGATTSYHKRFQGSRLGVQKQAILFALQQLQIVCPIQ